MSDMIEIRISGGIGNQMFQYALGYSLSTIYGKKLVLDKSYFDYDISRVYELDQFNLQTNEVISYMRNISPRGIRRYLHIFICIIRKRKRLSNFNIVQERENSDFIIKEGNYYFRGFWQNERYFKQYREELLRQFTLKRISVEGEKWLKEIGEGSVSIHVRRTDYIKCSALIVPSYYTIAIKKMQNLTDIKMFYIFTDDPFWADTYFNASELSKPFKIVSGNKLTDLEELMLMKECQHHIVANSSFSWWGGWLGTYEKKIVIAPKVNMWDEKFYPKDWLLIDTNITHANMKNKGKGNIRIKDRVVSRIKEIGYL